MSTSDPRRISVPPSTIDAIDGRSTIKASLRRPSTMKGRVAVGACSFPIESGHGCIGCSEPGFWDKGSLYSPVSAADWGKAGESSPRQAIELAAAGVGVGAVLGVVSAGSGRLRQYRSEHPLDAEPEEI